MNLTAVGPRLFVRPDELPEVGTSGLVLVHGRRNATTTGVVVALGDGPVTAKGVRMPHYVDVGERVVFAPDAGQEVFFEREVLVCIEEDDIMAVID